LSDKDLSAKHAIAGLAAREIEKKKRQQAGGSGSKPRRGNFMLALWRVFPLLAVPVIIYNLIAIGGNQAATIMEDGTTVAPLLHTLSGEAFSLTMMGDVTWIVSRGDILIMVAIICLFMEIIKSTSTGTATIMNHAVSMLLFIVCLVQFLLFQNYATSVFFIITMMTLLDVLAGVVVTIVSARRDFGVGEGFGG